MHMTSPKNDYFLAGVSFPPPVDAEAAPPPGASPANVNVGSHELGSDGEQASRGQSKPDCPAPGQSPDGEDSPREDLLRYYPLRELEIIQNAAHEDGAPEEYACLAEFVHLRGQRVDLEAVPLTDRQLIAVSLVFYGGVKKKRAARVMKISYQALDKHLDAALRKIEEGIALS